MKEFVIPDGYKPGMPLYEVAQSVIDEQGPMVVNYDGLEELYYEDLGVPRDHTPHVRWRRLPAKRIIGAFNVVTKKTNIDPAKAYRLLGDNGPLEVVLHEGEHLSFRLNHPVRLLGVKLSLAGVLGAGTIAGVAAGVEILPVQNSIAEPIGAFAGLGAANTLFYRYGPTERSARLVQRDEQLLQKYASVIDFPKRIKQKSKT